MIKLKKNQEQIELVKAIGSKNRTESLAAQESFAAAIGPVIGEVLMQLGTASMIFQDYEYGEDESPTYPLDFYYGEGAGAITVWSASKAGGLPSNWIESSGELRFMPYDLESAINFDKNYARKTYAFSVLSKAVERMINEILIKQERQAWGCILRALGEARTNSADHIIAATTANVLQLDDFNKLKTLSKRLTQSYAQGTSSNVFSNGATDLFLSPEMMEQIRGMAYQPMNTRAGGESGVPAESVAVPLPDNVREEIYRNAGASAIYKTNITELNELGVGYKYNILFDQYAPGGTFTVATDEVVIGLDLSRGAFVRAVENNGSGSATVEVDDQFVARSKKVGFYTGIREARVCLDGRVCTAVIV